MRRDITQLANSWYSMHEALGLIPAHVKLGGGGCIPSNLALERQED